MAPDAGEATTGQTRSAWAPRVRRGLGGAHGLVGRPRRPSGAGYQSRGVDPLLIEQKPAPSYFVKALGVSPRMLEIWDQIGIAREAIDAGMMAGTTCVFIVRGAGHPGRCSRRPLSGQIEHLRTEGGKEEWDGHEIGMAQLTAAPYLLP